ncbi:uncharacterized protein PG998_014499 [Apiospora kogelbergensis]|uniref:uncharacterized protein n=1 Tax=Apiospora kogelbergensis TaxID=1337665 RepID=UPI00312FE2D1
MSSVARTIPLSPVAQSCRSACDRCHQHKLKCERCDVGSVEVVADSSLTACKRCMKAKVQCRMATNSGSTDNNNESNNNRGAKRTSADNIFSAAFPTDDDISPNQTTSSGPCGSSLPSTDDALLGNVGAFDFGTGDFSGRGATAVSPTLSVFGNAAPRTQGTLVEDGRGAHHSYLDGLDLTLFGDDSNPLQSNDIFTTSSGNSLLSFQTPGPSAVPTTTEPDPSSSSYIMHDDCRRRLQSLHTTIFSELHHLSGADMDRLLSGRYGTTSLVHPESSISCDDNGGFIQKSLFASERLIELVRILDLAYTSVTYDHSHESYPVLSQACDTCDSILPGHRHSHSATSTPRHPLHTAPRSQMPFLRSRRTSSAFSPPPALPPPPTSSSVVDLPVIVSFLTCYVGLMVIYRNVLTQALNSLQSTDQYRHLRIRPGSSGSPIAGSSFGKGSASDTTATVGSRGVPSLGGLGAAYDAGSSNSGSPQQALRIRILTEVLSHMIERVEDAWDSVTTDEHGELGCEEDKHSYHHHHQQQQQSHSRHGVGSRRKQEMAKKRGGNQGSGV